MKKWNFKPYHQPIDEALERAATPVGDPDTELEEWEVFIQEKRGAAHVNVGAVHASDPEMALIMAKESFTRRQPCVNLWIVNTRHVHATAYGDEDMFQYTFERSYRNTYGFKLDKPIHLGEKDND